MRFDVAAISDAGPRTTNEDEIAWWSVSESILVCAIADGLGGMGGGSDASGIAITTLRHELQPLLISAAHLMQAAGQAHLNIVTAQKKSLQLSRMATTLTAAIFSENRLVGIHCGDTRASVARANGIMRLTADHSEGERLFSAGKLTKEELKDYPRKHILDSALGGSAPPRIDTFEFDLAPGDKIFFTTDGVHGKILLREMRDIAVHHASAQSFVTQLTEILKLRSPEDNFSVLAVFVF